MEVKVKTYEDSIHTQGRIWTLIAICIMLMVPFIVMKVFDTPPNINALLVGGSSICLIYLPSSIVEVITYSPMLGEGATYLAFVTGNLTNLKIPCVMNARDIAKTDYGTEENEIISTISVATSSIVNTLVLVLGVVLIVPLTPILSSETLAPAFSVVVPSLFGALGYKYFSKNPILAVAPLIFMVTLCLAVPSVASQIAILVPVSAVISIIVAKVLYNKNMV